MVHGAVPSLTCSSCGTGAKNWSNWSRPRRLQSAPLHFPIEWRDWSGAVSQVLLQFCSTMEWSLGQVVTACLFGRQKIPPHTRVEFFGRGRAPAFRQVAIFSDRPRPCLSVLVRSVDAVGPECARLASINKLLAPHNKSQRAGKTTNG